MLSHSEYLVRAQCRQRYTHKQERKKNQVVKFFGVAGPWDPSLPDTYSKGTKGFLHCSFKSGAFHVLKWIFQNIFLQISFFLVLTPRTCFGFNDFHIFNIHKKWRRPLLYQLFSKSVLMSTLAEPNQIRLGFVITNDKAPYVAKEESICLFIIAKEAALNEQ